MEVDKKSQREKRVVGVLAIVFALVVLNTLRGLGYFTSGLPAAVPSLSSVDRANTVASPLTNPDAMAEPAAEPSVKPVAKATYTAENLRDPFQSLFPVPPTVDPYPVLGSGTEALRTAPAVKITPPSLALQGLVWGGPAPKAIIANEVYGVGDTVQGATIKAIQREGMTIELQGQAFHVAIEPETSMASKR